MDRKHIVACSYHPLKIVEENHPTLHPDYIGNRVSVYEPVYATTSHGMKMCKTKAAWLKLYPHEQPDPDFICAEEPWKEAILLGISRKDTSSDILFITQRVTNNENRAVREHKWTEVRFGPHDQSRPLNPLDIKVKMNDSLQVFALANSDSRPADRYGGHTLFSFMRYPHSSSKSLPAKPSDYVICQSDSVSFFENDARKMFDRGEPIYIGGDDYDGQNKKELKEECVLHLSNWCNKHRCMKRIRCHQCYYFLCANCEKKTEEVKVRASAPFSVYEKTRIFMLNHGETCIPVSRKKT